MEQRIYPGTWCDVGLMAGEPWHVTSLMNGEVHRRRLSNLDGPPVVERAGRWLLFLRADGTQNGHMLVIGKDHETGHAYFQIDGGTPVNLGECFGIHPVEVNGFLDYWQVWVLRRGRYDVYNVNQFGTYDLQQQIPTDSTQGFLADGRLADQYRDAVPGLVNPFQTFLGPAVGQNAGPDPARLRVGDGSRRGAIYMGYAQRPNAEWLNGILYVAAYVGGGALLQVWPVAELPYGNDLSLENPDRDYAFVPNGTPIRDAFRILFGETPNRRGNIICLNKNIGQAEWRRIEGDICYFHADASRVPGDPGWWISPDPVWAVNHFNSGATFETATATIHDLRPGVPPNRWTQRNRLYGTVGGGICTEFDPRFPNQDYGEEKCYERFYNFPDGRIRWERWFTPVSARGRLTWGDRSEDVLHQRIDDRASGGPTPPFIEPPRREVAQPPPPPPPPTSPKVTVAYPEWKDMMGRLEDTYQNHGHHPGRQITTYVNEGGEVWRETYFALRAQGRPHEAAIRAIESQIDVIEGRPDRWASPGNPQPPIPGGSLPRLVDLREDGRYWADRHGHQAPFGIGALYALDGRDYRPFLDQIAPKVQVIRVFAGALSANPDRQEVTPGQALERLPLLLEIAAGLGLTVEIVCLTCTGERDYIWVEHVRAIARIARQYTDTLLTLANEVQHASQHPMLFSVLADLYAAARAEGFTGPIAYGANQKGGANNSRPDEVDPGTGRYLTAGGSYNTVHLARGLDPWYREVCRIREQEFIQTTHQVPVSNDEPNRIENMQQPVSAAFLMAALAKGFGVMHIFHSQQARDCQVLTGLQLEAFLAASAAWGLIPTHRYQFRPARSGGSPVQNASFVEGEGVLPGQSLWRVHSFVSPSFSFSVPTGPDVERGTIQWGSGWHPAEPHPRFGAAPGVVLLRITQ